MNLLVLSQALSLLLQAPASPEVLWHYSENAAFKEAKEKSKPLFVFSRTEWDLHSRWAEERLLARPDVRPLLDHYVCAQLWVAS